MTLFQLLMLGASAFFAYKVYEHIQTLKDMDGQEGGSTFEVKKSVEAFSPFDPQALIIKADKEFEDGNLQKAYALLKEANAKESQSADVLFKMGYIIQKLGENEEALKHYKEALELDKENEFIHNAIATVYRAMGEFVSAKMHLSASLAIDDKNPITYYNYGNLLVDMKHLEEAKEMYKNALALKEDFKEARDELEKLGQESR